MATYDPSTFESRWRAAWERSGCDRAPDLPRGPKFFNYDSGPFPTGPLHMGHVRTYALGDVTARYQRLRGKCVLYCTEWDAFGQPNELAALREGQSPRAFTQRWIGTMKRQLQELGVSYDWSRVRSTCDPEYYQTTQWLFLDLLERGLIEQRETDLAWCARCATALSGFQVERERCWRCRRRVETRRLKQWFVRIGDYAERLRKGIDRLEGWSPSIRQQLQGIMRASAGRVDGERGWLISRQRSWGTPIPIVHCEACRAVPVPESALPVRLPEDLDWSVGAGALAAHPDFVRTRCPRCDGPARRETDTLDCFFDDVWCQLSCLLPVGPHPDFRAARVRAWLPVDCFHSGFDTAAYLHLHRFLGAVLAESGELDDPELIRGHFGHEMVLARGRKMSKHLGNAVSPSEILRRRGADPLRVGILWASRPHKAVDFRPQIIDRAERLLSSVHALYSLAAEMRLDRSPATPSPTPPSRSALELKRRALRSAERIGGFIEGYRPHAAIAELNGLVGQMERFALPRLSTSRLSTADRGLLRETLEAFAVLLCPFAPHLAEEAWHLLGNASLVVHQRWPEPHAPARAPRTDRRLVPLLPREPVGCTSSVLPEASRSRTSARRRDSGSAR